MVNFNGVTYESETDGKLMPAHKSLQASQVHFMSNFNFEIDSNMISSQKTQYPEVLTMNLMAELSGLMQEQGAASLLMSLKTSIQNQTFILNFVIH